MEKKNKIVSLSGEPVTGKGSNVKALKQKLIEKGYEEKNIHIISTGHDFRNFFNEIINFIRNIDNDGVLKDLYEKEEIKSIIDNPKYKDKFIKAVSMLKAKGLSSSISIEQANNMPELAEIRVIVDNIIDGNVRKLGVDINKEERPNEIWIIDSRLAFKNIPESFAVRLTCRPDIAGKRLFEDQTRGKEDNNYESIQDAIQQREKRRLGEINRYKKAYNVDLTDENNYDVIIDTSFSTVDDISDTILNCLDRYVEGKYVPKAWASPRLMLPLQGEMETLAESISGNSLEEMVNRIKTDGYNMDFPIEIIEVKGRKYIIEGHHRNFALAVLDKSLIPYEVLDDETIKKYGGISPDKRAECCKKAYLWGHEGFFDKNEDYQKIGKNFSYNDIYPGIYKDVSDGFGIR